MPLYAEVVVPRHLSRSFTYLVPEALKRFLAVGDPVLVPFGAVTLRGLVVALGREAGVAPGQAKLRALLCISREGPRSPIDSTLLDLSRWIAEYYLAPFGQCLRLILPPHVTEGKTGRYALTPVGQEALAHDRVNSGEERQLLTKLARRPGGASFDWLRRQDSRLSRGRLTYLMERGWVQALPADRRQSADSDAASARHLSCLEPPPPPAVEAHWRAVLEPILQTRCFRPMLLEASSEDRTAAVLGAVAATLGIGRRAIVLAPEVRRVTTLGTLAEGRWGARVAVVHGERPSNERAAIWRRIRSGQVAVVIGTRTAVMAPLDQVGLICVDEEDHRALKDGQEPRYHARDVAWRRAQSEHAALLLLSSHALLETRTRIEREGVQLPAFDSPFKSRSVPVDVVPLPHPPRGVILSPPLEAAIERTLASGHRVALYLNRRGYAPALVCSACLAVLRCPQCRVALTYSREGRRMRCRTCGGQSQAPDDCPGCHGTQLELIGCGTERLEAEVAHRFAGARVLRLDRDTTGRTNAHRGRRARQMSERWEIVVGTRLMVGELPARSCGLVGIVYAEAGLHAADFRAAERTYQELQDVVQLVDPEIGGRAIVQTCLPTHPLIRALASGRREALDRDELALRRELGYPPYASLVALEAVGARESEVRDLMGRWAALLQAGVTTIPEVSRENRAAVILGPVPASAHRARGRSCWRLIVKGTNATHLRALVRQTLEMLGEDSVRRRVKLTVDVDPLDLD